MKKARCVPTIVSAALSLAFPLHSVFSYLKKIEDPPNSRFSLFSPFPLVIFPVALSKKKFLGQKKKVQIFHKFRSFDHPQVTKTRFS